MRTTRLVNSWSAMVLIAGVGGCAATTSHAGDGLRVDALTRVTAEERRQLRDSARAQEVADEVGPRVTVSADFDYAGGSRRVDVRFHTYDDAYVIVGHLDATGRLKVVFPSEPGDDGFVRGDKVYHVPSFFAGFGDEYAWAYSNYRYRFHSYASRRDSYDAGLGYVFVIASWRPMRLDRITDGNRWLSYEISDISYMQDPREAIEELGSLIAGDNREAYTIEYARYSTTNYGTYAFSDFDLVNGGCFGYSSLFRSGFRPFWFGSLGYFPSYSFGSGRCGYGYSGGVWNGYGHPVAYTPQSPAPPLIRRRPTVPLGDPVFRLPQSGNGGLALNRPRPEIGSPARREAGFTSTRPTIQQMIGNRRIEQEARGAGAREAAIRDNSSWSWANRGGTMASPRGVESNGRWSNGETRGGMRETGRSYGSDSPARAAPRVERNGEGARSAPRSEPRERSEPRGETARTAPAHSQPAARSEPAASGSAGHKKP